MKKTILFILFIFISINLSKSQKLDGHFCAYNTNEMITKLKILDSLSIKVNNIRLYLSFPNDSLLYDSIKIYLNKEYNIVHNNFKIYSNYYKSHENGKIRFYIQLKHPKFQEYNNNTMEKDIKLYYDYEFQHNSRYNNDNIIYKISNNIIKYNNKSIIFNNIEELFNIIKKNYKGNDLNIYLNDNNKFNILENIKLFDSLSTKVNLTILKINIPYNDSLLYDSLKNTLKINYYYYKENEYHKIDNNQVKLVINLTNILNHEINKDILINYNNSWIIKSKNTIMKNEIIITDENILYFNNVNELYKIIEN